MINGKINLLPWRDALKRNEKEFIAYCVGAALVGVLAVALAWFFYSQNWKIRTSQSVGGEYKSKLRCQFKSLEGLQEQHNAIVNGWVDPRFTKESTPVWLSVWSMKMVRVTPVICTLLSLLRTGDKFTIEGKAESPNTVAGNSYVISEASAYRYPVPL